jgi:2-phosphoglycerate kinase
MVEGVSRETLSLMLIGGAPGLGKSRLAHGLARGIGATVAQIDDLQTAIEALVPADRLPEYYVPATTYLRTDSADEINGAIEHLAAWFAPAVRGVIANRIESRTPTVFEGDFISPEVAAECAPLNVGSLFLLGSEREIRANFLQRDGDEQVGRARVSAMRSRRIAEQCDKLGLATLNARPFDTLLRRAQAAFEAASH